ncbi:MAG: head completion/stabilization protein [Lysobacter sp.]
MRNDGWFPDLSITQIRDIARLDGTMTDKRVRDAGRYAIAEVNRQLGTYKGSHVATGKLKLQDVDSAEIDGENRLVMLYRRAVVCSMKAELIERYRDYDSTDSGLRRVLDLDPAVGEQRRNASWAVRDILGLPHTVVELI